MSNHTKTTRRKESPKPNRLRMIPDELKQSGRRFVCCWVEERNGERIRRPRNPATDAITKCNDPAMWADFDTAYAAVREGSYDTLDFALSDTDDVIALDLDKCRNPNNKRIQPWAERILERLKPYAEVSPSGRGLRLFLRGSLPEGHYVKFPQDSGAIEIFSRNHFASLTGLSLRRDYLPQTIPDRYDEIAVLYDELTAGKPNRTRPASGGILNGWSLDVGREPPRAKLAELFRRFGKQRAKSLYDGTHSKTSQSESELSLANYAAGCLWEPGDIADLLVMARVNSGHDPYDKSPDYWSSTVALAWDSEIAKDARAKGTNGKRATKKRTAPKPKQKARPASKVANALANAKAMFDRHLYIEEQNESIVELVVASVVCMRLPRQDPPWLFLIGPPSTGKTEILKTLMQRDDTVFIDDITKAALSSGYVDPTDPKADMSILPTLNSKTLVGKDATGLIGRDSKQLFDTLRGAFDGEYSRSTGTGTKEHECYFNMVAAVTNAVESAFKRNAALGERFLSYRIVITDREQLAAKADANRNHVNLRNELRTAVANVLDAVGSKPALPTIDDTTADRIKSLALFLAKARTPVARDSSGKAEYEPEEEGPSRILFQLRRIAESVAIVRGKNNVDQDEIPILKKIVLDSLTSYRRKVLIHVLNARVGLSAKEVATAVQSSTTTIRCQLADLEEIGIAICHRGEKTKQSEFTIADNFRHLCERAGIVDPKA